MFQPYFEKLAMTSYFPIFFFKILYKFSNFLLTLQNRFRLITG